MHEASIAAPLLRLVLEETKAQQRTQGQKLRVQRVRIRAGLLQAIEPLTLSGIFALMAEGTAAEGAELEVVPEPMRGVCPDCSHDVSVTERNFYCPRCGGEQVHWTGGNELLIDSITVQPDTR